VPVWDAEAVAWYAAEHGERASLRAVVDALDLAPDVVIVDVGCGTGAALRHAAERVTRGRLVGIDASPEMVAIARAKLAGHPAEARMSFHVGAARSLPLADGVADVVLAVDALAEWDDPGAALLEVRRVLAPHGRFAVARDGARDPDLPEHLALQAALRVLDLRVERAETMVARDGQRSALVVAVRF